MENYILAVSVNSIEPDINLFATKKLTNMDISKTRSLQCKQYLIVAHTTTSAYSTYNIVYLIAHTL